MLRSLRTWLVAFLVAAPLVAVLGTADTSTAVPLPATVAQQTPVTPRGGVYRGEDRHGHDISLTYAAHRGMALHFRAVRPRFQGYVGHIPVTDGVGAKSCNYVGFRICVTSLQWTSETEVSGTWNGGSFAATLSPAPHPRRGGYYGTAHGLSVYGHRVSFHLDDNGVFIFGLHRTHQFFGFDDPDQVLALSGPNHHFAGCSPSICVHGHWQADDLAVGTWRPNDEAHRVDDTWYTWEAEAIG